MKCPNCGTIMNTKIQESSCCEDKEIYICPTCNYKQNKL